MAEVWDATKPEAGGPRLSAPFRQNWRSLERSPGLRNLAADPLFRQWSGGLPLWWAASGTGATVTQCGPALADTTEWGLGGYSAKLAYGSALARLSQVRIATLPTYWRGKQFALGALALATQLNVARLYVDDGSEVSYSGYIPATTEAWTTLVHEIDASATKLEYGVELASGAVYVEGLSPVVGPVAPQWFVPQELEASGGFRRGANVNTPLGIITATDGVLDQVEIPCRAWRIRAMRRGGGASASTVNVRRNGGGTPHLSTAITLTAADTWYTALVDQDAAYAAGDWPEARLLTVAGSPTQVVVLVDFLPA
jgi:hypothetical protein